MSLFDAFFPAPYAADGSGPVPERPDRSGDRSREVSGCSCGCAGSVDRPGSAGEEPANSRGDALLDRTLNRWTLERPDSLAVFHDLGLDACCGGERTLAEACARHGLDPAGVLERLQEAPADDRQLASASPLESRSKDR